MTERPSTPVMAALACLCCAFLFAFYRWQFASQARAAETLGTLADMLRIEAQAATTAKPLAGGTDGGTLPDFLGRAQKVASDNGVNITSVTTSPTDPKKLVLGVDGDYRDLMLFLGRLETFQISVDGFDLTPEENGVNGTVDVTFTGKPGAPESFADYLEAIIKYSAVRDPFAIGDPVPLPDAPPVLGDLTWTYRLSSIWQVGGERLATIDGRDYRPGDTLNSLLILAIDPSGVRLRAPGQALVQHIHFRRNPGGAGHG